METVADFIFWGSKITADGDCSHEIKRLLLFGRKTNLDTILKSRDITLPTKACPVKAMAFPVIMYGCESWTIKYWAPKSWCFWTMVLEKTLESPSDSKEIKPVNSKGNQPRIFTGRTLLKLQYFDHLMQRTNSLEKTLMLGKIKGKKIRGQQRMKWLDSITNSMNLNLSNSRR